MIADIVVRGFGTFGDVNLLPTRGYTPAAEVVVDLTNIPECRTHFVEALNFTYEVPC